MEISLRGLGATTQSLGPLCTQVQLNDPNWATDSTGTTWYNLADPTQFCSPSAIGGGAPTNTSVIPGVSNTVLGLSALTIALLLWMGVR